MYIIDEWEWVQYIFPNNNDQNTNRIGDIGFISEDRLQWVKIYNIFDQDCVKHNMITPFDFTHQDIDIAINETHEKQIYVYTKERNIYNKHDIESKSKIKCFQDEDDYHVEVYLEKDREMDLLIAGPNIKKRILSISNIDLIKQWIEENKKSIYRLALIKMKEIAISMNCDRLCFIMYELRTDSFKMSFMSNRFCKEPYYFIYKEKIWCIDGYKRGRAEVFQSKNCISASWGNNIRTDIEYPFLLNGINIGISKKIENEITIKYYFADRFSFYRFFFNLSFNKYKKRNIHPVPNIFKKKIKK